MHALVDISTYLILDELLVLDVELVVERDTGFWAVDLYGTRGEARVRTGIHAVTNLVCSSPCHEKL